MTNGARLFLHILAFQLLIANPVSLEYPIIPKIDCNDLNKNGLPDFVAVSNSLIPRSLYHIELKDSEVEFLWEYSMPEDIRGYFSHMIWGDYDHDGRLELIVTAYQDGSEKIFYVFTANVSGFNGTSPKILGIENSSLSITHPGNLYSMNINKEGYRQFILTQGSPSRHIVICKYIDGKIKSVGSLGKKFLSQSIGPLELTLGNFDGDSIEDIFILSNGQNPEGYFIFSDGSEEATDLDNYPHLSLMYNKGVDLNFDGIDDLLMATHDGGLMSNIWGAEPIMLSENKIQDIGVSLDNGLIHLKSLSHEGEIGNYTIDPLTQSILTAESHSPKFIETESIQSHSFMSNNKILIITAGKNPLIWSFPLDLNRTVGTPSSDHLQRIYSQIADYVINANERFIYSIEKDTTKAFVHFSGESLPSGMDFNLDNMQLEWTPTKSQLGFHKFSYILELREKGELEMAIENDRKLVHQKENIIEEENDFLIYVNDPVKFIGKEDHLIIVNRKPFEWIIPINDNNVDASIETQKILGNEGAEFQLLQWENKVDSLDSVIKESENIIGVVASDSQFQDISSSTINPHQSMFIWTPNTKQDDFPFSLAISDGHSSDTLEFTITIHPEIDLSLNQTEFVTTVNQAFSTSVELKQIPQSKTFSYGLLSGPENMRITANGNINWVPLVTQVDDYSFNVEVSDGIAVSKLQYNIYVNSPPVISSRPSEKFFITLGDSLFFPLESFDLNSNATLMWKLLSGPIDMILNSEGVLIWKSNQLEHHAYEIQLSDGIDSVQWNGSIYVNVPPIINSKPITFISENELYEYQLEASDENIKNPMNPYTNNKIEFELLDGPHGMEIGYQNILRWDPPENVSGEFFISLIASDGIDKTPQNFQLLVNSFPVITSADSLSVKIGDTLSFNVKADDSNLGDSLSYFIDDMRPGMSFDNSSGLLTWIPTESDIGQHHFNLQVQDGHNTSDTKQELQIFVYVPPIFTGDLLTEAFVGLEYTAFITGEDMFGKKLRDEKTIIVDKTTIKDYTLSEYGRYFQWTPREKDIGKHEIHLSIIDKYGFAIHHAHIISVFNNPCFQCAGDPGGSPADTTSN